MKTVFKIISFCSHQSEADCMWCIFLHSSMDTWGSDVSCRVELQKMKIVRPPADVARYTMVFHKRDSGNEINKDRSVNVDTWVMCYTCFSRF